MNKLYAEREIDELDFAGGYYSRHVSAMTSEGLNSKMAIASELAIRDYKLDTKDSIISDQKKLIANLERMIELKDKQLLKAIETQRSLQEYVNELEASL